MVYDYMDICEGETMTCLKIYFMLTDIVLQIKKVDF